MYSVKFYKDKNGNEPVKEYLTSLAARTDKDSRINLNKIREYKKKGNQYFRYWKNVNHWTLISPVDINHYDLDKLKDRYLHAQVQGQRTTDIMRNMSAEYSGMEKPDYI